MTITEPAWLAYHQGNPGNVRAWSLATAIDPGPTLDDVCQWTRGTITGPWCLPDEAADQAEDAIRQLVQLSGGATIRVTCVPEGGRENLVVEVGGETMRLDPVRPRSTTSLR